jgi:predicted dienelactone hydrolase
MRLFEILVLLAILPTLLWPIFIGREKPRWIALLSLLTILFAIIHLIVEGYRWQMVPAYTLACIVFIMNLRRLLGSSGAPRSRRWLSITASLAGLLILGVATALAALLPVPRLPHLTGTYNVGTVSYHWIDSSREEHFTEDPSDRREIMVQFWYPAEIAPGAKPAPYLSNVNVAGPVLARSLDLPSFLVDHIGLVRSRSFPTSPVAKTQPRYPVLIFSHGLGGVRMQNTYQVEELAGHGYIVVAIDHTYDCSVTVLPDNRILLSRAKVPQDASNEEKERARVKWVEIRAADARYVLDELEKLNAGDPNGLFTNRLDLERVGILGHSLGGATTGLACSLDSRFKAGINMDGTLRGSVIETGINQPFMFMNGEERWGSPTEHERFVRNMNTVCSNLKNGGYKLTIKGTAHYNFSDLPIMTPLHSLTKGTGPIDGERGLRIITDYSLAFFDKHLNNRDAPLLDGSSSNYPEVLFEKVDVQRID